MYSINKLIKKSMIIKTRVKKLEFTPKNLKNIIFGL
jgi:hypothetical protein